MFFIQLVQHRLELEAVVAGDEIHEGQAFQFIGIVEAEQGDVGGVGIDVHALVDVGNGVAGGFGEGLVTLLGFLQLLGYRQQLLLGDHVLLLAIHHVYQVRVVITLDDVLGAGFRGKEQLFLRVVGKQDEGGQGRNFPDLADGGGEIDLLGVGIHQHHVGVQVLQQGIEFVGSVGRAQVYCHAGIPQGLGIDVGIVDGTSKHQEFHNITQGCNDLDDSFRVGAHKLDPGLC